MTTWVVLPTYNEAENIEAVLRALLELPVAGLHVLVVDDSSPDGTGTLVRKLMSEQSSLHLLERPHKEGLARAYVDGFRYVLARGADYIFEMDADFSHNPAVLPNLLTVAERGADLVLGSRYMPGGQIVNWNWPRRWVSRMGNAYARWVLGITIADLTGGYKCFRRTTLERIQLDAISSTGYNFQIELTWKALRAGCRVQEIPITFTERRLGRSKFHAGIIFESMLGVWRLRARARHATLIQKVS